MTTKDDSFRSTAIRIAGYSAISYVVAYSSQLVDIFWVARLSSGAPTAVAFVATVFAVALTLNEVVGVSSVAIISRAKGAGDKKSTALAILQTLCMKLVLGLVMVLVFLLFIKLALPLFTLDEIISGYIREYASVIWLSLVLIPINATLLTTLRIFDKARFTAWISVAALCSNALLTPLLIFGYREFAGFGVAGAAWSSIIVEAMVLVVAFSVLQNRVIGSALRQARLRVDLPLYRDLLLIGLPVAGMVLLLNLEQVLITSIVVQQPVAVSDGFGIGQRLFGLLFISTVGISLGVAVVTGEALGRGDWQLVAQEVPAVLKKILCFALVLLVGVWLFSGMIMGLFTTHVVTIAAGALYLRFMAVAMMFYVAYSVFAGVFEGAGKNLPILYAAAVVYLVVEFPLLAVAGKAQLGLLSVWIIVLTSVMLLSLILGWLFVRRYWATSVLSASH